jgi:hypothetical protein
MEVSDSPLASSLAASSSAALPNPQPVSTAPIEPQRRNRTDRKALSRARRRSAPVDPDEPELEEAEAVADADDAEDSADQGDSADANGSSSLGAADTDQSTEDGDVAVATTTAESPKPPSARESAPQPKPSNKITPRLTPRLTPTAAPPAPTPPPQAGFRASRPASFEGLNALPPSVEILDFAATTLSPAELLGPFGDAPLAVVSSLLSPGDRPEADPAANHPKRPLGPNEAEDATQHSAYFLPAIDPAAPISLLPPVPAPFEWPTLPPIQKVGEKQRSPRWWLAVPLAFLLGCVAFGVWFTVRIPTVGDSADDAGATPTAVVSSSTTLDETTATVTPSSTIAPAVTSPATSLASSTTTASTTTTLPPTTTLSASTTIAIIDVSTSIATTVTTRGSVRTIPAARDMRVAGPDDHFAMMVPVTWDVTSPKDATQVFGQIPTVDRAATVGTNHASAQFILQAGAPGDVNTSPGAVVVSYPGPMTLASIETTGITEMTKDGTATATFERLTVNGYKALAVYMSATGNGAKYAYLYLPVANRTYLVTLLGVDSFITARDTFWSITVS